MYTFIKISALSGLLVATGCATAQNSGTVLEARNGQVQTISHSYKGINYPLNLHWDSILKAFIVNSKVTTKTKWTSSEANDIRFQNMVRSAFRAKVCEEGLHPGIIAFGYGFSPDPNIGWIARVKCTKTFQPDA